MRTVFSIALTVASSACVANPIELAGSNAALAEAGAPDAVTPPTATTVTLSTCMSPGATAATLGEGFSYERPSECSVAAGAREVPTTVADAASSLVGLWYDCTGHAFGIPVAQDSSSANAIELTADGRYVAYGSDSTFTLVPLTDVPGDPHLGGGSAANPSSTGTYSVVDASATLGPGAYALDLHPANGGLFTGQVTVTTSPRQLHFFPTNAAEQVFTPPLPWSARKGVCSCLNTTATASFETDSVSLEGALVGRWMWCAGDGAPAGNIGIEFAAGNVWYPLDENQDGSIVRGPQSTFTFAPTTGTMMGPEPLTISLNGTGQAALTQLLYVANPRTLLVGIGTSQHTDAAGNVSPIENNYSICVPMP